MVDHPRPLLHIQHGSIDLQLQALCRQRRRRIGPITPQLMLCYIAERVLGLPKSY